ncbi:hypothetical protein CAPTEDRAFT_226202 [Capitella teleta]|uniref:Uncharacterized protein n=1 Tax=Capitella teleta TaxID=283909 RepID=R7TYL8_CAPTE|nr:hypothetical protein CAPTEDRAFT_226202 [Capitella teleta]|eukprot:ELT99013.1 hypothetical protein CAPTEDRAFT_226202 [Capitella teleta]
MASYFSKIDPSYLPVPENGEILTLPFLEASKQIIPFIGNIRLMWREYLICALSWSPAGDGLDLCPESSRWTCRCPQHIQPRKEKDLEEDASFHRPAPVMSEDED